MSASTKIIQASQKISEEFLITDYAKTRSTNNNLTIDSVVAQGDILIAAFTALNASSATVPEGYTEVISTTNFQSTGEAFVVFYKILDGTEGGTTIPSPLSGTTLEQNRTLIIRPSPNIAESLTLADLQQATSTTSTTLTANISSADGPCIATHIYFQYGSNDDSNNVSLTADVNLGGGGGGSTNRFLGAYQSGYVTETSGGSQEVTYFGTNADFNMVSFLLLLKNTFEPEQLFSFNSENGGLEVLSVNNSNFGTGDFTYEAWVYPTDLSSNYGAVIGHKWSSGGGLFYVRGDGGVTFYEGANILDVGAGTISTNQWYHIAAVRSSGTLTLYIDGTSVGSTSYTNSITDTNLYVGQNQNGGENFQGYIYAPHVLDSAKYTGNFTPATNYGVEATSLILLETNGDTAEDLQGNSVTNNGAIFVSESPS